MPSSPRRPPRLNFDDVPIHQVNSSPRIAPPFALLDDAPAPDIGKILRATPRFRGNNNAAVASPPFALVDDTPAPDRGEILRASPRFRGSNNAAIVSPPYALLGDVAAAPPPGPPSGRGRSQFAFRGPEEVLAEDIAMEHRRFIAKNPHAGKGQRSHFSLNAEEQWTPPAKPSPRGGAGPIAQSTIATLFTDYTHNVHAGRKPPPGHYYNADGDLQKFPSTHAAPARQSKVELEWPSAASSSPAAVAEYAAEEFPNGNKAHVENARAARSLISAVVFGRDPTISAEEVEASMVINPRKRQVMTWHLLPPLCHHTSSHPSATTPALSLIVGMPPPDLPHLLTCPTP